MCRSVQRRTLAGFVATMLFLLMGCGQVGPTTDAGQRGGATDGATKLATMTSTPGAVTLRLGQAHAGMTDTVSVTVVNGLPTPILVEDHQSECTVVTLEQQVDGGWLAVAPCQLETPTLLQSIRSGATETVTLRPAGGPQPRVWQAGTYRFALSYSAGEEGQARLAALSPTAVVRSQTFTIG